MPSWTGHNRGPLDLSLLWAVFLDSWVMLGVSMGAVPPLDRADAVWFPRTRARRQDARPPAEETPVAETPMVEEKPEPAPVVTVLPVAPGPAGQRPPDWVACPKCRGLIYAKRFARCLNVCPDCGHHSRLSAPDRLTQLLDPHSAIPLRPQQTVPDPLGFVDSRPYRVRLEAARRETGLDEAALAARGTIQGLPVVVVVMDFRFIGGSLGSAVGEIVAHAADAALTERVPLILVTASGGARMQEGGLSLMQMAKTSQALAELDEAGLLTVSVVTDPTFGGVAASFATQTDVILAEPGARMGFAGPRVIRQTTGQELPAGFQTAEFLLRHGLVDDVVPRALLRPALATLIGTEFPWRSRRRQPLVDPAVRDPDALPRQDPWETVRLARHPGRPTTTDYIAHLLDGFQELHGDRMSADCPAIVGGLGRLDDIPLVVIGHQKGHSTRDLAARNFGMASPAGYRKVSRLLRLAAKLRLPVLTLVDTPGADPSPPSEEHGQSHAIAENLKLMSGLPVPVVTVVCGEGGSGGALGLGVADRVLALSGATYSVISPEGCASILWKSTAEAPRAAEALGLDTPDLLRLGIVDGVVPEPYGGAHADPSGTAEVVRDAVGAALHELLAVPPADLVRQRRDRYRRFGLAEVAVAAGAR